MTVLGALTLWGNRVGTGPGWEILNAEEPGEHVRDPARTSDGEAALGTREPVTGACPRPGYCPRTVT